MVPCWLNEMTKSQHMLYNSSLGRDARQSKAYLTLWHELWTATWKRFWKIYSVLLSLYQTLSINQEVNELSWARGGYLEAKERILSFHNSQQHLWHPLWLVWELINATLDDEHSDSHMIGTYFSFWLFPLKWVLAYVWRVFASNYPVSAHIYMFRMEQQWAL